MVVDDLVRPSGDALHTLDDAKVIGAKSVELQIDGLYHGPRLAAAEED
jgi:hypothetical protein